MVDTITIFSKPEHSITPKTATVLVLTYHSVV